MLSKLLIQLSKDWKYISLAILYGILLFLKRATRYGNVSYVDHATIVIVCNIVRMFIFGWTLISANRRRYFVYLILATIPPIVYSGVK